MVSAIGKMENNNTSKSIIGCYLYDDLSISYCLNKDKHAIGLIFDVDKTNGNVWVMALKDSDCIGVHTPNELPKTDADFEKPGYNRLEWTIAECRHWEKLLINVCGCCLEEIVDGFEEHCRGYSFDTDKANETLSKIRINIGENGYIYWTSTMESNGWAEVVGCGEIIEDPMPYTDDEIAECRLRFVGRLNIKELKTEDLAF